jgi:hypothetical protein
MSEHTCHNCKNTFDGNFCSNCGQRNLANKRLQMREVINDFFDNTFNLHKGFLYTFWQLIIKPGKVANAYIDGYRKTYTNPTRYLVIALAFQSFIDYQFKTTEVIKNDTYFTFSFLSDSLNKSMEIWNIKLAVEYILFSNLFMIILIPAIFYIFFKRLNFNYTELLTVSFYYIPTILFITMPILFITKVIFGIFIPKEIIILIFMAYLFWSNLSFFKVVPFWKRFLKIITVIVLFMIIRVFFLPYIISLLFPLP